MLTTQQPWELGISCLKVNLFLHLYSNKKKILGQGVETIYKEVKNKNI